MKKNILFFLILATACLPARAQKTEGVIQYERVYNWVRIYQRLEYLSQEERDRIMLTRGNSTPSKTPMKLVFNNDRSFYTYALTQGSTEDGRYSWKLREYVIVRNFAANTQTDWIEMLGRTYQIEDTLRTPNWKIMNKIKDVAGHICMMAVAEDTVKRQKITAWFADDIPAQVGPGTYFGLPGAILELDINDGDVVTTAVSVDLSPVGDAVNPPSKIRGRKINGKQYDTLIYKYIQESIKAKRPYFEVPF